MTHDRRWIIRVIFAATLVSTTAGRARAEAPDETVPKPGTTVVRRPKINCCITNARLLRLKLKIRELAGLHNAHMSANNRLRKMAEAALKEQDRILSNGSGFSRTQLRGFGRLTAQSESFLRPHGDFSDRISLVGNRIDKAERLCNQAEASADCRTRKARMRSALGELERALNALQKIEGASGALLFLAVTSEHDLDKPITSKLRRTKEFFLGLSSVFSQNLNAVDRAKKRFPTFKAKMLADC